MDTNLYNSIAIKNTYWKKRKLLTFFNCPRRCFHWSNSTFQIGQYTQKTLPHPRRREPDLRLLEPISYTSARNGHNPEIIAPVPPQFADSSPEEFSKVKSLKYFQNFPKQISLFFQSSENVAAKIDMTMTRF